MATLFEDDFERTAEGPDDWGNSWDQDEEVAVDWSTDGSVAYFQGDTSNIFYGISHAFTESDVWDALIKFRKLSTSDQVMRMGVRNASGQAYGVQITGWAGDVIKVTRYAAGQSFWGPSEEDESGNIAASYPADTWLWLRVNFDGTVLRVRGWNDGGSEPGSWETEWTPSAAYADFVEVTVGGHSNSEIEYDSILVTDDGTPSGGGGTANAGRMSLLGVGS